MLEVAQRTLARACRETRGTTPKQLVDSRVLLEAKRRLTTTTATVEVLGMPLEFTEATNIVKYLKRFAGTTPEAFRARYQN